MQPSHYAIYRATTKSLEGDRIVERDHYLVHGGTRNDFLGEFPHKPLDGENRAYKLISHGELPAGLANSVNITSAVGNPHHYEKMGYYQLLKKGNSAKIVREQVIGPSDRELLQKFHEFFKEIIKQDLSSERGLELDAS